jgi:hypothetical protein
MTILPVRAGNLRQWLPSMVLRVPVVSNIRQQLLPSSIGPYTK